MLDATYFLKPDIPLERLAMADYRAVPQEGFAAAVVHERDVNADGTSKSMASNTASDIHSQRGMDRNYADETPGDLDRILLLHPDSSELRSSSLAATLPTELLQEIYRYLSPQDFNAARHTCLRWMSSSLNLQLLTEQLKRDGWWSKAASEPVLFQDCRSAWPMSCFLAQECALTGGWTGNGLAEDDGRNPLIECCSADFEALRNGPATVEGQHWKPNVCSSSSCGKYYVKVYGPEIYIYKTDGLWLHLLSRVMCGSQVLAVSIDTTADCFALAAILEKRVGIYIDLLASRSPSAASP